MKEFMAARDIARAALFGYSMGGYVALYVAAALAGAGRVGDDARHQARVDARGRSARDESIASGDDSRESAEVRRATRATTRRGRRMGSGARPKTATLMKELGARPTVDSALLARIQQPARSWSAIATPSLRSTRRSPRRAECRALSSPSFPTRRIRSSRYACRLLASLLQDFIDSSSRNAR